MIYHAHVYYTPEKSTWAKAFREKIARSKFEHLVVGKMHDHPVGPHTQGMFQIIVDDSIDFKEVVQMFLLDRGGLSVLFHANTGDALEDHTVNCFWMGTPVPLDTSRL